MFDQILDTYRRAAESTMQLQQSMFRNWTQQLMPQMFGPQMFGPQMFGLSNPGAAFIEQAQSAQKKWSEAATGMLNKHRKVLDEQYRAGIKTIEDAFRVGEAKDPEHFRKLTEELWKHSFEALKTVTEEQTREFQAAMQKWMELMSQSAGVKI
jgi:hypothetical protein